MYGLEDVKRFAFDWLRFHLAALTEAPETHRGHALNTIAYTNWRWTARPLRDLLLNFEYTKSPRLIEAMLQTLFGVDPRHAVDTAMELAGQVREPWRSICRIFLAGMPARYREGIDSHAFEEQVCAEWLPRAGDFDDLVLSIAQGDLLVRLAAVSRLATVQEPAVPEILKGCLTDESSQVLRKALEAMRAQIPDLVLPAAEQALHQRSVLSRQAVADFLVQSGPAGIELLLHSSRDNPEWVVAARALVHHAPARAMEVFEEWSRNSHQEQRMVAVEVLYELVAAELRWPSGDTAERLARAQTIGIGLLDDQYEYTRSAALVLLAELGWSSWRAQAVAALESPSEPVRLTAVDLLDEKDAAAQHEDIVFALTDLSLPVRERAFLHLQRQPSDPVTREAVFQMMLASPEPDVRRSAAEMIGRLAWAEAYGLLSDLKADENPEVRAAVLAAGAALAPDREVWLRDLRRACRDKAPLVRQQAVTLLGQHGGEQDLERILQCLTDADDDVRSSALHAACRLAPDRCDEFAVPLIGDSSDKLSEAALQILSATHPPQKSAAIALEQLLGAQGSSGPRLLERIAECDPALKSKAIERGLKARNDATRQQAAQLLAADATDGDAARFKKLLRDRCDPIRLLAVQTLLRLAPDQRVPIAVSVLRDSYWRVRQAGIEALADLEDPQLVEPLLPLARDADSDIRREAIRALAKFDDVRVLSELISSLTDLDNQVASLAEQILSGHHGPVPALASFDHGGAEPLWKRVQAQVTAINAWAVRIGGELLGKPVTIQNYRQGLGRTHAGRAQRTVTIQVSDTPVTSGHPQGAEIMRGLVLHEIGHHLYDIGQRGFRAVRGIARSEGVGEIFDILLDERLERRLRARRPEWGVYFDRLASYAFAQNLRRVSVADYSRIVRRSVAQTRRAILARELPGELATPSAATGAEQVLLRDRDMLAIDGLVPLSMSFLACLRCGFDPRLHPNPKVVQAVGLVPSNLKDLEHKDLLALARQIGKLIGTSRESERKKLHRRLGQPGELPPGLLEALGRLIETGQLPGIDPGGAPDIRRVVIEEADPPRQRTKRTWKIRIGPAVRALNLGPKTDFSRLDSEEPLAFDPAAHAALIQGIRKHIRRLRSYFERLGTKSVDEFASLRGRRLDLAQIRKLPLGGRPSILVHSRDQIAADAYLGILVDRSGSMSGDKLERAKAFCALLAESARDLPGIEGHVNAFDDHTFYRLGDFRRTAIASLDAGDGNNDSGALARAAELALQSGKRHRLLIMISDGCPTECTFESLKNLVRRLERQHDIGCAQVAVESLGHIAFPHYVDLSACTFEEAVIRFGKTLIQLTASWR